MKMDLIEFLLVFLMFWKISSGLRCYKCEAMSETYTEPLCEHFDYSPQYLTDCESSSMCYMRITTSQFGTKIYERGCAKQTMNGYQEHLNGHWRKVNKINEVYDEGCMESPGDVEKVTKTVHCFCRGDMCNADETIRSHAPTANDKLINNAKVVMANVFVICASTIRLLVLR